MAQSSDSSSKDLLRQLELLRLKLRRQLLRDLYHGVPLAGSTLDEINDYYCWNLRPGTYNVLMIRLHPKQETPDADVGAALTWVDTDVRMFLSAGPFLEFETLIVDDALYCIFNFDAEIGSPESETVRLSIDKLFRHMDISRRYRQFYFTMGDGLPARSVPELGASFLSARNAVEEYGANLRVNRRFDSTPQMYALTQIMNVLTPARRASFSYYLETTQQTLLAQWVDDAFRDCRCYLDQFPTIAYQLPYKIFDLCLDSVGNVVAADPQLQQVLIDCRAAADTRQDYDELCQVTKDGLLLFCSRYASSFPREHSHAVSSAREFMWNNFTRRLTLDEIAGQVHLNPQYFSVLFKRETGESVVSYLTNLRIEQAKTLLKETPQPINEIARASGFEDPDYFSRVFRRICGMSPREYRTVVCSS